MNTLGTRHEWGKTSWEHLTAERMQNERPAVALATDLDFHRPEWPLGRRRIHLDHVPGIIPGAFLEFVRERLSIGVGMPNVQPAPAVARFWNTTKLGQVHAILPQKAGIGLELNVFRSALVRDGKTHVRFLCGRAIHAIIIRCQSSISPSRRILLSS